MNVIFEEVEGMYYAEVVFSPDDLKRILGGEMLQSDVIYRRRKCYISARLKGRWDEEDSEIDVKEEY